MLPGPRYVSYLPTTSLLSIVRRQLPPSTSTSSSLPISTPSSSSSPSKGLSTSSVSIFTFVFVAVGMGTVLLAAWSRWCWIRQERRRRISSQPVRPRRDLAIGLSGGDGWGRAGEGRKGDDEGVLIRPKILEAELNEAEKLLCFETLQPLSLSIKPVFPRRHPPPITLSVLILPPSEAQVRPHQRHPNSNQEDGEEELPEIEIATLVVDLALKSDFKSRAAWESYKKRLKEEEVAWARKVLEEEEEDE
ncbi:hypothetical protein BDY24DRAFT_391724 [Mrakia frigida]|uniref:uncharacterized protein n=1 Tax=Mrakia frigida TaxID=29902 RepID=UPI003FCC0099